MKSNSLFLSSFLFLFLIFSSINVKAAHIIGGEIHYTFTGPLTVSINLTVYRDCSADAADATSDIDWSTGACGINGTITLNLSNVEILDVLCPSASSSCGGGTGSYGVEALTYTGTINIPPGCPDLLLTSEICCRSGNLTNVNSSGNNHNQFIHAVIDPTFNPLNSFQFVDPPVFFTYVNSGTPTILRNEVSDPDGDSTVFYFVDAYKNSTNVVNYSGGYSGLQPLGAGIASINSETGDITLLDAPIMVATIAILVEEYRNGVLIGSRVRDWTLTVLPGSNAAPVVSGYNTTSDTSFTQCTYTQVCADIIVSDIDASDVLTVTPVNPNPDINITVSPAGVPSGNQVTVNVCSNSLTPGIYYFDLNIKDDHCPVYATTKKTFSIEVLGDNASTDTRTECNPFTWIDGNVYTANNTTAMFTIGQTDNALCDSIRILDLTIINPTTGTNTRTECAPFVWIDGNTYNSDNSTATYTISDGASNGCDSVVTLDLTILNPASGTNTRTECAPFAWIDGNTYNSDNSSATHTVSNGASNGCDSIVTLDLTILNPASGTNTRTECAPFVWIDGNTYNSDNSSATHTVSNGASNGCDSIVTLDLTIQNVDVNVTTSSPSISSDVTGANYKWLDCNNNYTEITGETNQSFNATSNGSYAVEVTVNGCADTSLCIDINTLELDKSTIVNQVTIFPNPSSEIFNIDFGNLNNISIFITDINGKKVFSKTNINGSQFQFRLNEVSGIYFLEVRTASGSHQFKLIKN